MQYKMKPQNLFDWFRYDLVYGIKNFHRWFKVIWSDRDYDPYFIYTVLHHKLKKMEHFIRHDGHHLYRERDADQIKKCVLLLDRLIEDEYHETAFKEHEKKWGFAEMDFSPCEDKEGYSELHIKYPNEKTEADKKQNAKELKEAFKHEDMLRKQDLEMLFSLMNKHIQGWWD